MLNEQRARLILSRKHALDEIPFLLGGKRAGERAAAALNAQDHINRAQEQGGCSGKQHNTPAFHRVCENRSVFSVCARTRVKCGQYGGVKRLAADSEEESRRKGRMGKLLETTVMNGLPDEALGGEA